MKTAADIMSEDLLVASSSIRILDALELMRQREVGAVFIKEDDQFVGLFTERDLVKDLNSENHNDFFLMRLADIEIPPMKTVDDSDPYVSVIEVMKSSNVRYVPVKRDGQIAGIISMKDLMNELDRANDEIQKTQDRLVQAEKMNAVAILAGGIAHEVKNPLAVIIQGINYLKVALPDQTKDINEVFDMMREGVKRADTIVRSLNEFTKKDAPAFQSQAASSVVDQSLALILHDLHGQQTELVREFTEDVPHVWVDQPSLEQAIYNVLLNAVQALSKGGKLTVRIYQEPVASFFRRFSRQREEFSHFGKSLVVIEVEDDGEGIPAENLSRVFQPFFTTRGPREGAGLGLPVTKNILDIHKGFIALESEENKGTKVSIALKSVKER